MRSCIIAISMCLACSTVHAKQHHINPKHDVISSSISAPPIKPPPKNTPKKSKRVASKQLQHTLNDDHGAWTLNTEINIYGNQAIINTMIDYVYSGWNIGISAFNIPMYNSTYFTGDVFLSVSKSFQINDDFQITIGTQNGVQLFSQQSSWQTYNFLEGNYIMDDWVEGGVGLYVTNAALTGDVNRVGMQISTTIQIIPKIVELQGIYLTGSSGISGGSINMAYNITPRFQLYCGILTPPIHNPYNTQFAGVVGFNISTHAL